MGTPPGGLTAVSAGMVGRFGIMLGFGYPSGAPPFGETGGGSLSRHNLSIHPFLALERSHMTVGSLELPVRLPGVSVRLPRSDWELAAGRSRSSSAARDKQVFRCVSHNAQHPAGRSQPDAAQEQGDPASVWGAAPLERSICCTKFCSAEVKRPLR